MKRLLILFTLTILAAAGSLRAQLRDVRPCVLPPTPSIVDYFAIAAPLIQIEEDELMANALAVVRGKMQASEKVVDRRNGYISVTLGRNEDTRHVEACYWRMAESLAGHQRALLGVYYFDAIDSGIFFFEFDRTAGTVRSVEPPFTLPSRFVDCDMRYELPRTGKTIKALTYCEVTDEGEPAQINLNFNGTSFDTEFVNLKPEIVVFPVINDDETAAGIYNEGERCTAIGRKDAEYCFLVISDPRGGWWRIKDAWLEVGDILPMLDVRGGQINYKNVGAAARNYDGAPIPLHTGPSADSEVVFSIGKKTADDDYYPPLLRLIDMSDDGEWVKVEVRENIIDTRVPNHGGIGWIETFWLCGNPLTNCN